MLTNSVLRGEEIHTQDEIPSNRGVVWLCRVARAAEKRLTVFPGSRGVLGNARSGCHCPI